MSYLGQAPGLGEAERFIFTASGSETSVTADDNGVLINYTVGQVSVYLNGVKLVMGTDFTATNGSTIAGLAALTASDVVEVIALSTFSPADTVPATGGTFSGNVVMSGNLTVNGTTTTIDTTNLIVEDKNIEMASVDSPTDSTADGGGITLKGTTDKTLQWSNTTKSWEITPKLQQKGQFMKYSTHQSWVMGG